MYCTVHGCTSPTGPADPPSSEVEAGRMKSPPPPSRSLLVQLGSLILCITRIVPKCFPCSSPPMEQETRSLLIAQAISPLEFSPSITCRKGSSPPKEVALRCPQDIPCSHPLATSSPRAPPSPRPPPLLLPLTSYSSHSASCSSFLLLQSTFPPASGAAAAAHNTQGNSRNSHKPFPETLRF